MAVGPMRAAGFSGVQAGRARRGAGGFALPEAGEDPFAPAGVAAPPALGGLLALQDSNAPERPEAAADRARRRASMALDELRGLQLDLLRETPGDAARLGRLEALAAAPEADLQPQLGALLAEVRLRARLELARRNAAATSRN